MKKNMLIMFESLLAIYFIFTGIGQYFTSHSLNGNLIVGLFWAVLAVFSYKSVKK